MGQSEESCHKPLLSADNNPAALILLKINKVHLKWPVLDFVCKLALEKDRINTEQDTAANVKSSSKQMI